MIDPPPDDVFARLTFLKNTFYEDSGGKNLIFKKKQKLEIAKMVCSQFDLAVLLKKTIFPIQYTNIIFIDYKMFKLYANETIYTIIVEYTLDLFNKTIEKYGSYSVHLDMETITPSAAERYKNVIIMFNEKCTNTSFINHLKSWVIYNTPQCVDLFLNIIVSIIDPLAMKILTKYTKEESVLRLKELLEHET